MSTSTLEFDDASVCASLRAAAAEVSELSRATAETFFEHAMVHEPCGELVSETPEFALRLMELVRDEISAEMPTSLEPLHTEYLSLGRLLSARLPSGVRDRLSSSKDLEPLLYEVRHAIGVDRASAAEVRAAVAISEIALACEGLAMQDEVGLRKIFISARLCFAGNEQVPHEYLPSRVQDAIACDPRDAFVMMDNLLVMVLEGELSLPGFDAVVDGRRLVFVHEDDDDRVKLVTEEEVANIGPETSADYVIYEFENTGVIDIKSHGRLWGAAWQVQRTAYGMTCLRRD
jgi:hypothetical protein